jgi:chromosome segregation ATPase
MSDEAARAYNRIIDRLEADVKRLSAENAELRVDVDKKNRLMERQAATHMQLALGHTRLEAENAALRAENERLTPREMTLEKACDTLNRNGYRACKDWRLCVRAHNGFYGYDADELLKIAQGLPRDAGPIADGGGPP